MIQYRIGLILLTILFAQGIMSQSKVGLKKVSMLKWSDGTEVNKLHNFEDLFSNDAYQIKTFRKFNRARIAQKTCNYIGLGLIPVAPAVALLAIRDADLSSSSSSAAVVFIFAGAILVGPAFMLLSNMVLYPIKAIRKKKLLKTQYDPSLYGTYDLSPVENVITFSVETTTNGLGVFMRF